MNQQEKQYMQLLSAQVVSIAKSLDSNPAVKGILFPVTNFPECILQGHDLALTIESIAKEEFNKATTSVYGFSQEAVRIVLSNPLLTILPVINPAVLLVMLVLAADPAMASAAIAAQAAAAAASAAAIAANSFAAFSRNTAAASAIICVVIKSTLGGKYTTKSIISSHVLKRQAIKQ
ncbi:hypothetical protein BX661DRAFT_170048 [Kickxella alabastrina]|uniref:uncharacterized protein n=1 Tax=Kickxella alabastrina TaxID=61397 RepID=UPI00221FFD39|nr:uncharacterized protein BX661DRAFT_170048 [Kickxella alabastrina]KAI7830849.1 hypothetical protein BX661DRAFT_170048 [Kickxella alabastrina]